MTPDWQLLSEEAAIVAALVLGLAKRAGCDPEAVLDTIGELIAETQPRTELQLISNDPQAAA